MIVLKPQPAYTSCAMNIITQPYSEAGRRFTAACASEGALLGRTINIITALLLLIPLLNIILMLFLKSTTPPPPQNFAAPLPNEKFVPIWRVIDSKMPEHLRAPVLSNDPTFKKSDLVIMRVTEFMHPYTLDPSGWPNREPLIDVLMREPALKNCSVEEVTGLALHEYLRMAANQWWPQLRDKGFDIKETMKPGWSSCHTLIDQNHAEIEKIATMLGTNLNKDFPGFEHTLESRKALVMKAFLIAHHAQDLSFAEMPAGFREGGGFGASKEKLSIEEEANKKSEQWTQDNQHILAQTKGPASCDQVSFHTEGARTAYLANKSVAKSRWGF